MAGFPIPGHLQKRVFGALLGFGLLAAPLGAAAQSNGFYLSGAIGAAWPTASDYSGTGVNAEAQFDPGLSGLVAAGTTFGENWRGEVSLSHRVADVDAVSGAANGSGDMSGSAAMVNGYYDLFSGSDWRPYVGAGVGVLRLSVDSISPVGGSRVDDDDTVAAVQGIVGIGYRLSDRIGLFTDYRYLAAMDPEFKTVAGVDVDSEYSEHRILIGLRWSFGGPSSAAEVPAAAKQKALAAAKKDLEMPWSPPERSVAARRQAAAAPNPAAAPKPAAAPRAIQTAAARPVAAKAPALKRRFLVYFDWDRWDLNDASRSIVRNAAEASTGPQIAVIRTTGHADRSGPVRYNLKLSKQRAEAVKAEFVKLGVPAKAVTVQWMGEKEPVAQTADGVREPLNRRVEIVLQ